MIDLATLGLALVALTVTGASVALQLWESFGPDPIGAPDPIPLDTEAR